MVKAEKNYNISLIIAILTISLFFKSGLAQEDTLSSKHRIVPYEEFDVDCERLRSDSVYFSFLNAKCEEHLIQNHAVSVDLATQIIKCFESKFSEIQAWQYPVFAFIYNTVLDYEKSNVYYLKTIEAIKNKGDSSDLSGYYYMMGSNYLELGLLVKAIESYHKCYDSSIKFDEDWCAISLYQISSTYLRMFELDKAEQFLLQTKEMIIKKNKKWYIQWVIGDLGYIELIRGNYDTALIYLKEAEQGAIDHRDYTRLVSLQRFLGELYVKTEDYENAIVYFKKNYDHAKKINKLDGVVAACSSLGNVYIELRDLENAEYYFKEQLDISKELNVGALLAQTYNDLRRLYANKGDYRLAIDYFKLLKKDRDFNYQTDLKSEVGEVQIRFENQLIEQEMDQLSEDNEKYISILRKRLQYMIVLFFVIVLLIIAALIFIRKTRLRNKQKIAEINQKFLRSQMNPHFIFNTLNSIQYHLFKNEREISNNYLTKFSRLLSMVFENSKSKSVSIDDEIRALTLYLELEKLRFKEKLNYKIEISDSIDAIEYKIPPLLLQPFVENSILHGIMPKGSGTININMQIKNDLIECKIKDDGIGRKKSQEIKSHKINHHNSLGVKISENRLKDLNTLYRKKLKIIYNDLVDQENVSKGTEVILSFPIMN